VDKHSRCRLSCRAAHIPFYQTKLYKQIEAINVTQVESGLVACYWNVFPFRNTEEVQNARSCCILMDSRVIAAKKSYDNSSIYIAYTRMMNGAEYYRPDLCLVYIRIMNGVYQNYGCIQKLWMLYFQNTNGIYQNYEPYIAKYGWHNPKLWLVCTKLMLIFRVFWLMLNTSMVFMPKRVGYESLQDQQMTVELLQTKGRAQ
jgi:hypothetical protein